MKRQEIDVALLQETKRPPRDIEIQGYRVFLHGKNDKENRSGVGIMLSPKAKRAWERAGSPLPIGIDCARAGRIIALRLDFADPDTEESDMILVISAHLPHSGKQSYSDEDYDDCLEILSEVVNKSRREHKGILVVIGGDLNAQLGTVQADDGIGCAVGPYGITNVNARGKMFLRYAENEKLVSTTTHFESKSYGTWRRISDKILVQIDHVLVDDMRRIANASVDDKQLLASDHQSISITILEKKRKKKGGTRQKRQQKVQSIRGTTETG